MSERDVIFCPARARGRWVPTRRGDGAPLHLVRRGWRLSWSRPGPGMRYVTVSSSRVAYLVALVAWGSR